MANLLDVPMERTSASVLAQRWESVAELRRRAHKLRLAAWPNQTKQFLTTPSQTKEVAMCRTEVSYGNKCWLIDASLYVRPDVIESCQCRLPLLFIYYRYLPRPICTYKCILAQLGFNLPACIAALRLPLWENQSPETASGRTSSYSNLPSSCWA